jgi:hypothetical protein
VDGKISDAYFAVLNFILRRATLNTFGVLRWMIYLG